MYEGGCWIEQIPVRFENRLYLASIPDMYEPNEIYKVTGFFDEGTVEIWTDPNNHTLFNTGYVDYTSTISADATQLTVHSEYAGTTDTETHDFTKKIDMSKEDPNSYRALIIAPFSDINEDFEITFDAIRTALTTQGIAHMELLEKNANWDNISIALRGSNLNYVYWIGHTNSQIGETRNLGSRTVTKEGVHRTYFKCWDKRKFMRDNPNARVFSFLQSDSMSNPPTLDKLPDNWETKGHSMWSLGLHGTQTIKEFWAIGCETGLEWQNAGVTYNYNDMAFAVGSYYKDQQGNYVHVYMGNREPVWFSGGLLGNALVYPDALAHIIQRHVGHDLEDALVNGPRNNPERRAVWGIDENRDGLTDNVLQWWPLNTKLDWINFY